MPPPAIPVQHHHAHLAAVLAEHQHEGRVLGVIWDGTGYGHDGTIWGGELLLGTVATSERVGYLRPFPLPGGDAAVREPRRVALALLHELYGSEALTQLDLPPLRAIAAGKQAVLQRMIQRGLNCIATSSAGRLFDGVAALLGLCQRSSFEGEAAMLLEYAAAPHERSAYPLPLVGAELDWRPALLALLDDVARGVPVEIISARFHNAMVAALVAAVQLIAPPAVALSGGCFQNRLLTARAAQAVEALGVPVLLHRLVPPNDGGIALGQVAAVAARLTS